MEFVRDGLRAVRRAPFSNAANVLALSLGFACFLGAFIMAAQWGLSDYRQTKKDRIVAITQQNLTGGESGSAYVYTSLAVGRYLALDFPELEETARLREPISWTVAGGDWKATLVGSDADNSIFDIFDFDFIRGNPATALAAANSVVLTRSVAEQYFVDRNPVGETITLRGDQPHTITAVVEDIAPPSFFGNDDSALHRFDFLRSFPAPTPGRPDNWMLFTTLTYALLPPDAGPRARESFNAKLQDYGERRMPDDQWARSNMRFAAIPLDEVAERYLETSLFTGRKTLLSLGRIVLGLGAFVLMIACLNYVGLATALSALRAREVGMRKVLGASQAQIARGIWLESLATTVIGAVVALGFIVAAAPSFDRFADVDVFLTLSKRPHILAVLAMVVLFVSLAVSVYPAVYMTRMMRPIDALRLGQRKSGPQRLGQALVGAQFFCVSVLLIVILVMGRQSAFLEERNRTASADPVAVVIDVPSRFIGIEKLKGELAGEPSIKAVSTTYFVPWGRCCVIRSYTRAGQAPQPRGAVLSRVGPDFFKVYDPRLLAGRVFDSSRDVAPEDGEPAEAPVVIDRAMARKLGFASPDDAIDELMLDYDIETATAAAGGTAYRIVGVIEALPLTLSAGDIRSNVYMLGGIVPIVRVDPDRVGEAMTAIQRAVDAFEPNALVEIRFTDALFKRSYEIFRGLYVSLAALSGVAFVIAAIGLLGMATFAANRRRHDIGVRKTLGATSGRIVRMLLKDFSRPILIGNLLAWPAAGFLARGYLQNFMDQAPLTPVPWVIGLAGTLVFGLAIVGGHAWRAARTAPIEVLRSE